MYFPFEKYRGFLMIFQPGHVSVQKGLSGFQLDQSTHLHWGHTIRSLDRDWTRDSSLGVSPAH